MAVIHTIIFVASVIIALINVLKLDSTIVALVIFMNVILYLASMYAMFHVHQRIEILESPC